MSFSPSISHGRNLESKRTDSYQNLGIFVHPEFHTSIPSAHSTPPPGQRYVHNTTQTQTLISPTKFLPTVPTMGIPFLFPLDKVDEK
jgi:hypothetical protein